jgi:hypothetical protein
MVEVIEGIHRQTVHSKDDIEVNAKALRGYGKLPYVTSLRRANRRQDMVVESR